MDETQTEQLFFILMEFLKISALAALAFSISFLATPLTAPLCKITGSIDNPDGKRKINTHPIPRMGGLGFFLSTLIVLLPFISDNTVSAMLTSGAILVAGGVADDTFGIAPRWKFLIQAAAALVAIIFIGIPDEISFFGIIRLPIAGVIGFAFMLYRMIFTTNAVNFCDGLDGLATGLSVVALISLSVYGMVNSNTAPSIAAIVLAFSALGFLPYNKYHAKLFMGDCGSQFLGLSIAILSLGNAPDGNFTLETSLFLAVPTIDTVFSVIRRILKRKSPFAADKGHLHHILLKSGISHPFAVKLLVSASAAIALATLVFILP